MWFQKDEHCRMASQSFWPKASFNVASGNAIGPHAKPTDLAKGHIHSLIAEGRNDV
jgi:hypothetical protein